MNILTRSFLLIVVLSAALWSQRASASHSLSDWADWRGPTRDGISYEKGLPEKWSPTGENLLWKQPYGGRSAPIIMGGRVFLFNSAGEGATMQERVVCFDAETGKLLWQYRFNVYSSDVPPRRIAWSSPAGDPQTGNVYVFGACNELVALSIDGKLLWNRSFTDEFGAWTTHGGRTVSPIVEGNLVIVSTVTDGFADLSLRRHRYYAFNKLTGESVWISTAVDRPFDTTYSTPITTTLNGTRMMIAGAGDGNVHALKVNTGEPIWSYPMSKRGINPGVVLKGNLAFVSHPEENLDTTEMGLLAAVDVTSRGKITKNQIKWSIKNIGLGPASPVIDGDRIYHIDGGSNLYAFDIATGKQLWMHNLGTIQKASPVLADGKLYVGTENGKFYILKPGPTGVQILDQDELEGVDKVDSKTAVGDDLIASNEQVIASVGISRGRIYMVSTKNIYCIGSKRAAPALPAPQETPQGTASSTPAFVQVVPADVVATAGQTIKFKVNLFDEQARFIREEASPALTLDGLKGATQGKDFTPATEAGSQAGTVKATVGALSGVARVRVFTPIPSTEDFSSYAVDSAPRGFLNFTGKYLVRELEGNKVLLKRADLPPFKRTRSPIGPAQWSNYTVEADVRGVERRRQLGDVGIVAQRYELILFGNNQRIDLQSWQIEPSRTVKKPFAWKADTWYRLKLRVERMPDGKVRVRGKAWPAADAEPADWLIERVDPIGHKEGAPGIFVDSPNEVFFDNIKITPNK